MMQINEKAAVSIGFAMVAKAGDRAYVEECRALLSRGLSAHETAAWSNTIHQWFGEAIEADQDATAPVFVLASDALKRALIDHVSREHLKQCRAHPRNRSLRDSGFYDKHPIPSE